MLSIGRRSRRGLFLAYALALCAISLQLQRPKLIGHGPPLHRYMHVAGFAGLAAAGVAASRGPKRIALVILVCAMFGVAIELTQHLLYGADFEWADLADDAIGSVAGAAIVALWTRVVLRRNEPASGC